MTWKRCNGCTRAISVTAFTCEYCGRLCDDVMDFRPADDRTPAAPLNDKVAGDKAEAGLAPIDIADLWADEPLVPAAVAAAPASSPAAEFSPVAESSAEDHEFNDAPVMSAAAVTQAPRAAGPGTQAEVAEFGLDEDPWSLFDEPAHAAGDASAAASAHAGNSSVDRAHSDFGGVEEEAPASECEAPAPAVAAPSRAVTSTAPKRLTPRQMAMAGAGVMAASALIFTSLSMRGSASPEPAAVAAKPAAVTPGAINPTARKTAAATPAAAVVLAADAPKWSRVTDGRWVGTSRHAAAFELPAANRVHVWTRDVTPVLVVRCDRGTAEAFVFTQSAARMEPQDGDHTVRVAFDGGQERTERWPDSAEHDALFARHHQAFTQQLAESTSLRFGFTPHNADPVTATFAVDGLAELLSANSRQCGWKK